MVTLRRKSAVGPLDAPPASGEATDGRSFGPGAGWPRCAGVSAPNCHTAQTASASCRHHTDVEPNRKSRAPTAPHPRKRIVPSCPRAGSGIRPRTLRGWPGAASAPWDQPGQQPVSPAATTPGGAWTSPSAARRRPNGHTVTSASRARSLHTNGQTQVTLYSDAESKVNFGLFQKTGGVRKMKVPRFSPDRGVYYVSAPDISANLFAKNRTQFRANP